MVRKPPRLVGELLSERGDVEVWLIVVRKEDTAVLLKACSEELGRSEGAGG